MTAFDPEAIRIQLGLSREEMIARFGNPGEKTPEEIGSALGLDHDTIVKIFGEKVSSDSGDEFITSNTSTEEANKTDGQVSADDQIKAVADALGFSPETVEKVMSAIADGTAIAGMDHKTAVETLASQLGIDKYYVGMVLEYLDENKVGASTETTSSTTVSTESPSAETVAVDDKIKAVADKLGFEPGTVEKIMSAIVDGTAIAGMDHKTAVETLSGNLGIDKYYVGMVLEYLDESSQ